MFEILLFGALTDCTLGKYRLHKKKKNIAFS